MMLMALSMTPLHSLGQDSQNEMHHDIFGHVLPLEPGSASHDINNIINSTIAFLRARQLKACVMLSCDATGTDFASCDAHGIINGMTAFLRSG